MRQEPQKTTTSLLISKLSDKFYYELIKKQLYEREIMDRIYNGKLTDSIAILPIFIDKVKERKIQAKNYSDCICTNLAVQQHERSIAQLFGDPLNTNVHFIAEWIFEILSNFEKSVSELQKMFLIELTNLQMNANYL